MHDETFNSTESKPAPEISVEPVGRPKFDYQLNGPMFMPHFWYWVAEDGRVYSSERQMIVNVDDSDFKKWLDAGFVPTKWPRDIHGEETKDALRDVVKQYGKSVP
jgi:hypothetical protein